MAEMIRWTPTLFEAQAGAFSSSKRYVRAGSGGYALASGRTCLGNYVFVSNNNQSCFFHFTIPGILDVKYINAGFGAFDPGTPTPTVQAVKI